MNKTTTMILIAASLFTSCNTFKKVAKEKEITEIQRQRMERKLIEDSVLTISEINHSSSGELTHEVVLEIVPVGTVSYSPTEGFRGEAKDRKSTRLNSSH